MPFAEKNRTTTISPPPLIASSTSMPLAPDPGLQRPETTAATTVAAASPTHSGTNPLTLRQYHHQCECYQGESRLWGHARQTGLECPDFCRVYYGYPRRRARRRTRTQVSFSIMSSSSLSNFLSEMATLPPLASTTFHRLARPGEHVL